MIGKVSAPRGTRVEPLIRYLFGPGRHEEHTDAHIVAGWRHPAELEPPLRPDGRRGFRRLNGLLNQPHAALGPRGFDRPVWHCALRAAPGDRILSDDECAQIACDVMHRTGLAPYGEEDDAVRWIAVRHADDHIHLVAMLARQDGRRPNLWHDYYRIREACQAAEQRYGLRATAPADRTAARRPTRAEHEKARRRGRAEPARVTLRRHVATAAAAATSEPDFFARLRRSGVLVRTRFSTRNPGEITGYAVALPGDTTAASGPVWYSGGKLAPDLTLPKLRHRWHHAGHHPPGPPGPHLTWAERDAIWQHAAHTATTAADDIRRLAATDPAAAADAAWAASDILHTAAAALGNRTLRRAADAYGRAARPPYARIPRPTPAGTGLRRTARLFSALGTVSHDPSMAAITLVIRLAALAETVADLRRAQRHAAQAAAARTAAERLRSLTHPPPKPSSPPPRPPASRPTRPRTVADLVSLDFPYPPGTQAPPRPSQNTTGPSRRARPVRPSNTPPHGRGRAR